MRNHGGRKELVAPAPVTNRRPSGAAVASFLGQSPAIIPKRTAERNWSRPRRLQIVAHLARRWRRFWAKAPRLFQKDLKISAASRVSKSVERTDQGRRRIGDR